MIFRISIGLCFVASLFATAPVLAWGDAGHRMVCRVAWKQLLEQPRNNLKDLLGVADDIAFAETCAWADASLAEHPETAAWHQIYVPKDARSVDVNRDCTPETSCVIREIERNVGIARNSVSTEERAMAVKLLAHLVGDVHQPLNVAFAEDRGGREIAGSFLGVATNMHAIWDTQLIETDPAALAELATMYHAYTPLDRLFVDWLSDLPEEWANESLWVMRTPATGYLGNPGGLEFEQIYVEQNRPVAFDRIAKAGMRLGHLLNDVLR